MSAYPTSVGQLPAPQPPKKNYWRRTGGSFLAISILAHVLLIFLAAYYVIHVFTPSHGAFQESVPMTNPATKAEQQAKQNTEHAKAGAPLPAKQITTSGMAEITLPPVPDISTANTVSLAPLTNGGVQSYGGTSISGPHGTGTGPGTGPYVKTFGSDTFSEGALKGTFYDLKFTSSRKDSGMNFGKYAEVVTKFVKGNWSESILSKYLKGTRPLYAKQIFFPEIESTQGPTAFNSPMPDSPGMWVVVYKGMVAAPESGTYHFVGAGDDDMIVRFNGKLVLDKCEHIDPQVQSEGTYHYNGLRNEFGRGTAVTVEAGKFYPIEILIGDHIPTKTMAMLLIEKEGVNYEKQGDAPILPPFSLDAMPASSADVAPAHVENGPVWKGRSNSTSLLDQLDQ